MLTGASEVLETKAYWSHKGRDLMAKDSPQHSRFHSFFLLLYNSIGSKSKLGLHPDFVL